MDLPDIIDDYEWIDFMIDKQAEEYMALFPEGTDLMKLAGELQARLDAQGVEGLEPRDPELWGYVVMNLQSRAEGTWNTVDWSMVGGRPRYLEPQPDGGLDLTPQTVADRPPSVSPRTRAAAGA